jgi:tRNA pseudouridine38-40 synthase
MSVVRLDLAYDGTDFHGWAAQPGVRTVQGVIEDALVPLVGTKPKLSVAGRTDVGVHAQGQVASFVAPEGTDPEQVQRMLNAVFAPEVVVRQARLVPDGFNARHSATAREYVYRMDTGPVPSPFTARFVWHRPGPLAIGPMRMAARHLLGERDFTSFCRSPKPPSGTVRNLRRLTVRAEDGVVEIGAEANAFLHQMVRSLVGTLVRVGDGRLRPDEIPAILEARSRAPAGNIAPSRGLTLLRVRYGRGRRA